MATFYGGEQLVNTLTLAPNSQNSGDIIYTCPSGRYAEIFIKYQRSSTFGFIFKAANITVNNSFNLPDYSSTVPTQANSFIMNSGDQLYFGLGIATVTEPFNIFIKEYTLP